MVNIMDLCSGKWEQEIGGDSEWEVMCTGWHPDLQRSAPLLGKAEAAGYMIGAELQEYDLDVLSRL